MESKRDMERAKFERPVNIRQLSREASSQRAVSIDTTTVGVGFASIVPLKVGSAVVVDDPDMNKNALLLCSVKHCTPITGGKFHVGVAIEDVRRGHLTTTQIPADWWNAN